MSKNSNYNASLRQKAEELVSKQPTSSDEKIDYQLHELNVHQIELEMQNEELRLMHKAAEEGLERYTNLYDYAPVGYCTINVKGEIVKSNLTTATLLGVARGALINQPLTNFIHKGDQDIYYLHRKKLIETEIAQSGELRMLRNDGEIIWVRIEASSSKNADGSLIGLAILIDISAQKKAEQELESIKELYRTVVEDMPVLVCRFKNNGQIIFVNDYYCRYFNMQREELIGKSFLDLIPAEDRDAVQKKYTSLNAKNPVITIEHRVSNPDGTIRWQSWTDRAIIDKSGSIEEYQSIGEDITKRKLAEEKLRASEELHRSILLALPDPIIIMDMEGTLLQVSAIGKKVFGYDKEDDFIGHSFLDFIVPEDKHSAQIDFKMRLQNKFMGMEEYRILRKDGSMIFIETNSEFISDESKSIVVIVRDITIRKQAEESLLIKNLAVENSINAIALADLEGNMTYANRSYLTMWGYADIQGVLGKNILEFWQEPEKVTDVITAVKTNNSIISELKAKRKDNSVFDVIISANLVMHQNGTPICLHASFEDITERKKSVEELIYSEEKYRSLFESMTQGVVILNVDGVVISTNPAAERILGLSFDQLRGLTPLDPHIHLIHEDGSDFQSLISPARQALLTGEDFKNMVMGIFIPKEEKYRWVNMHITPQFHPGEDKPYQSFTTFEDISERKYLELLLQKNERDFSSILNNATDIIGRFDTDLHFIYGNNAIETQFGISLNNIIGKTIFEVDLPLEIVKITEKLLRKVIQNKEMQTVEQELPSTNGNVFLMTNLIPESDEKGSIQSLLFIARDISEHKRMEMELQDSLKEKEALLHEIHHRVKNNLQVITSLLGLQAAQVVDPTDKLLFKESQDRVQTIAMVHEVLLQNTSIAKIYMKDYLEKLIGYIQQAYSHAD